MNISIIKKPSAWIPIAMPLTVLIIMLIAIVMSAVPVHQADEGTGAHLFQIWMVLEIVCVTFFLIKWFPRDPKPALVVLALQIGAALLPMGVVFFLKL